MDRLRLVAADAYPAQSPCSRCSATNGRWDRLADKVICPGCEESLALGEADPLVERIKRRPCAACHQPRTLCYVTFPLNGADAVEIDLCGEHLRDLFGRRLGPHAYHQLRRQLRTLGVSVEDVFLLHDAFYDVSGRALQPVHRAA